MLDIKLIRENPDIVRKDLEKRRDKDKIKWVDEILEMDEKWRRIKHDTDKWIHKKKEISEEINKKKKQFLDAVIEVLGLEGIEVCELDFRAFIRTTEAPVDLFVSRASLNLVELSRLFKPGCSYKNSKLIYWSSKDLEIDYKVERFVKGIHAYKNANKQRNLVILGL